MKTSAQESRRIRKARKKLEELLDRNKERITKHSLRLERTKLQKISLRYAEQRVAVEEAIVEESDEIKELAEGLKGVS